MDFEALKIAQQLIKCFKRGNKLLICGCGGSSALASHFMAELVGHYLHPTKKPLPAIALNDPAVLSAASNDRGFEFAFSRQVEALGKKGDILISISTSGRSKSILNAIKQAKKQRVINIEFPRQGIKTGDIQDYQSKIMHQISEIVELEFLGK